MSYSTIFEETPATVCELYGRLVRRGKVSTEGLGEKPGQPAARAAAPKNRLSLPRELPSPNDIA